MDYNQIPNDEKIDNVVRALKKSNIEAIVVENKEKALEFIQSEIPEGASINNGSSTTLAEIGYVNLLKSGDHKWRNIHGEVLAESDEFRKSELQREQVFADYYLGSVHALTENGEIIFASASGSQMPHLVFTSPNLLLITGANKIVKDLTEGFSRIGDHIVPLEDARMKSTGAAGTNWAKTFIMHNEPDWSGRKVKVVIVKEKLGF